MKVAASRIAPLSHGGLYGDTFHVRVDKVPINIAYTDEALKPHMDLAYYESPPGLQFLHCVQFDEGVVGGDSIFYDTFVLAEILRDRHPEHFDTLCRVPATFMKDHLDRDTPAQMFFRRPHIATNHLGEVTAVFWSPAFEGPLVLDGALSPSTVVSTNTSKATEATAAAGAAAAAPGGRHNGVCAVQEYYEAYRAFAALMEDEEVAAAWKIKFRLSEGTIVSFNQRRLLHGRDAFTGHAGTRWLEGCYVGIDDFLNRYRTLHLTHGNGMRGVDSAPRAGNSCWR